ncbi:MAG: hypothetical protein DRP64_19820 [Verrucomicrobia bacterium]|nr:MAG: hypothetical protein DRP64_19820 [Verrucomicrobiota bacterium]
MNGEAAVWIVAIVAIFIYNLYKLRHSADPKDELLKAKQLLDENLISEDDYQKIKGKLIKKIVAD